MSPITPVEAAEEEGAETTIPITGNACAGAAWGWRWALLPS